MNALSEMLGGTVGRALGGALVHATWQGLLVAAGLAVVLAVTGDARTRARACVVALLLLVAAPAATFAWSVTHAPDAARAALAVHEQPADVVSPRAAADAPAWLASLTTFWLAGVLVFGARVLWQWRGARRLVRRDVRSAGADLERALSALVSQLRLSRRVRLLLSARVDVPLVVGWLAPVVLLPLGAADVLTPAQVRAVRAHELAHVKRLDGLVNLVQAVVEALLFFHPAAWWVSARLRVERRAIRPAQSIANPKHVGAAVIRYRP